MATVNLAKALRVFARDGYRCVYCGRKGSGRVALEIDHVTPRSWGRSGTNAVSNLVTACARCNNLKGDLNLKLFLAYLKDRFGWDPKPVAARVRAALRKQV